MRGVKLGGLNAGGIRSREEANARAMALRPVLEELAGKTAKAIAAELNAMGIATPNGRRWHTETVIRVQRRLGAARSPSSLNRQKMRGCESRASQGFSGRGGQSSLDGLTRCKVADAKKRPEKQGLAEEQPSSAV